MNTLAKSVLCVLVATGTWAWSETTPRADGTPPSVSEIAVSFTNYQRMTRNVVSVNPQATMLCTTVSKAQIEAALNAARIKFGPHANTGIQNTGILIFMNKAAAEAFSTNAVPFPVGAVIVKQKTMSYFDKDGKSVREENMGVGGMVKRPAGYDPQHGDWEYLYFEDTKKIESGRIPSCVQCHESTKSKDYVFGTWNNTGR